MRYLFIAAEKAHYPVTVLCGVLRLSTSGFYIWMKRPASKRAKATAILQASIRVAFDESRGTYGSPRIHAELVTRGSDVSKTRVEREMRKLGLLARRPKRFRVTSHDWMTRAEVALAIAEYLACFYNTRRRHSYLNFKSPAKYERMHANDLIAA